MIADVLWRSGLRVRNALKRFGLLGPLEPFALRFVPAVVRPPAVAVDVALTPDVRMRVPAGYPAARSYAAQLYEVETTRCFTLVLEPGMTVVDVGANIGYYVLLGSRLIGPQGRVYAFEPDPKVYAALVENCTRNHCDNVRAVAKAVCDTVGSGNLVRDRRGAEGFLVPGAPPKRALPVETTTLDAFFAAEGWPSVDLVKLDVEGSEVAVLRGMRELCRRNPTLRLITELNPQALRRAGSSTAALARTLLELGFERGTLLEGGMKQFSVAQAFPRARASYNLFLERERGA